jgi:transcriptional regulator with XRE-family HTH domain
LHEELIGQNIRRVMRARGISNADLARSAGLSKLQVWLAEQGAFRMPSRMLLRFARVLGVSPARLLAEEHCDE